jgi:hypothetical protein
MLARVWRRSGAGTRGRAQPWPGRGLPAAPGQARLALRALDWRGTPRGRGVKAVRDGVTAGIGRARVVTAVVVAVPGSFREVVR